MSPERNLSSGMCYRWHARFAWLAIVALLSNTLVPSAYAIGVGWLRTDGSGTVQSGFCGSIPASDAPLRGKPGPCVHHCVMGAGAQQALPASREAAPLIGLVVHEEPFSQHPAREPSSSFRSYWGQPRAPPAAL